MSAIILDHTDGISCKFDAIVSTDVGKTIINHPRVITIFIGGINHYQTGLPTLIQYELHLSI